MAAPSPATVTRAAFTIPGDPVPWARAGKRGRRHFTQAPQAAHMTVVRAAWAAAGRPRLGTAPVALTLHFFRLRPPSHYGTGRNRDRVRPSAAPFPAGKPDSSNFLKLVEDALNDRLWHDDAQIVRLHVLLDWADQPGGERRRDARTELTATIL